MKKVISMFLSLALILTFPGCVLAGDIQTYTYESHGSEIQKTVEDEVVEVTVKNGDCEAYMLYNSDTEEFELILYEAGEMTVHRSGCLAVEEEKSAVYSDTVTNDEDIFFGYSYYYNTESAYGDYYWRLLDPNRETSSKYFFTAKDSYNNKYAFRFVDEVDAMIDCENKALIYAPLDAILDIAAAVGSIAIYNGLTTIGIAVQAAATALEITSDVVDPLTDAYACALNADMWYDFIDETIRP